MNDSSFYTHCNTSCNLLDLLGLTCDQAGDHQGQDQHLQHPHEDLSWEGDDHDDVGRQRRDVAQQHPSDGAQEHT